MFDVPVDTPIHVTLVSRDVMHEFFVPQLLFMRNAIPGHPNVFTFTPTKIGTYHGQCAQFCGLWHSRMTFTMKVVAPVDYAAWVKAEKEAILQLTLPGEVGFGVDHARRTSSGTPTASRSSAGRPRPSR